MGGVFPGAFPIGQIVDSRTAELGLYTEARVKLNVNLGALEQSLGSIAMNILNTDLIFAVAYLSVFGEAALPGLRHLFGRAGGFAPRCSWSMRH